MEEIIIPAVTRPSRALAICRWIVFVPAAVLCMNVFQNVMRYMIAHSPDEMFSLPGTRLFADVLMSFFAGGLGVSIAAYVAPSRRATVATSFASVVATIMLVCLAILWKSYKWWMLLSLATCAAGAIAAAVKVNMAIAQASADRRRSARRIREAQATP